jgi:hypothetical protein
MKRLNKKWRAKMITYGWLISKSEIIHIWWQLPLKEKMVMLLKTMKRDF